ncbi:MAG: hypothetical protein JXM71_08300 [Spirochaetales bacterium]|nr:hypothetical protein [Spirochaetales bacterium]
MPAKRTGFFAMTAALLAMAFVVGFFIALLSIGNSGVLYRFALRWEALSAILFLAAWTPAIILVASALAMESSEATDGFSGAAYGVMAPALALATAVSIFYILVIPVVQERTSLYEGQSALFNQSIALVEEALLENRLEDADRHLIACGAIDQLDSRFVKLNDAVQSALVRAANEETPVEPPSVAPASTAWEAGNRFYIEALAAKAEGRVFDAHYLAKRSAAIYGKRPEVRRLVDETWRALERLEPSMEELEAKALYERKLAGYSYYQEGDFLAAFRVYSELYADNPEDTDVATFLGRSQEGLKTIAFFIEEDERAFARSDGAVFSVALQSDTGTTTRLSASRVAVSENAVYFRDARLSRDGPDALAVSAPFARLHGTTLILRAVDRQRPTIVWNPVYEYGAPIDGHRATDSENALELPFSSDDAETIVRLSGNPADVSLLVLAGKNAEAERFGLDVVPLLVELAGRTAYPFAVIMLVLLGAGLGVRFKPTEKPGPLARYLSAPLLVAFSVAPLRAVSSAGDVAARALASWVPRAVFLPAWLGFMGACVALCLVLAARIAGGSSHSA